MSQAPELTTERLRLRPHIASDFEPYCELFASDRSIYMGGPLDREAAWRQFVIDAGQWAIYGSGAWGVETLSGVAVGQVAVCKPITFPEMELGWLVYDGFEGKGFAFEAARRAMEFAFGTLGATTLVSYVDPQNVRSAALAQRLGGTVDRQAATPNDEPTDVFRYLGL